MKQMTKVRLAVFLLALLAAVSLSLPAFTLAGSISVATTPQSTNVRGSIVTSSPPNSHHPKSNSFPLRRNRAFLVGNPIEQQTSVTILQTPAAPSPEPSKTPKNRVYVQPRWVDADYGVQILQPGHWIDLDNGPEY